MLCCETNNRAPQTKGAATRSSGRLWRPTVPLSGVAQNAIHDRSQSWEVRRGKNLRMAAAEGMDDHRASHDRMPDSRLGNRLEPWNPCCASLEELDAGIDHASREAGYAAGEAIARFGVERLVSCGREDFAQNSLAPGGDVTRPLAYAHARHFLGVTRQARD